MVQKAGPRMRPCLWTWTGCLLPGVRRTHRGALAPHPKGTCREQGVDKAGGGPAQPLLVDEAPAHLEQAGSRAGCSRPLARHRRLEVGRARRLRLAVHWPPCRVRGLRHATRRGSRRRRTGPRRPGDIADAVAGVLRRGLGPLLQDADHDGDARGVPGERLDADRMRQQDQPIDRGAGDLLAARQAEGGHERGPHGERVAARLSRRRGATRGRYRRTSSCGTPTKRSAGRSGWRRRCSAANLAEHAIEAGRLRVGLEIREGGPRRRTLLGTAPDAGTVTVRGGQLVRCRESSGISAARLAPLQGRLAGVQRRADEAPGHRRLNLEVLRGRGRWCASGRGSSRGSATARR